MLLDANGGVCKGVPSGGSNKRMPPMGELPLPFSKINKEDIVTIAKSGAKRYGIFYT